MERIMIHIITGTPNMQRRPATEIARILRRLALDFEEHGGPLEETLFDSGDRACGTVVVEPLED